MNRERLFMPVTILFLICAFTFGFIYFYKNIYPIKSVLSKKDVVCNDMPLLEAIELAKSSKCIQEGVLEEDRFDCDKVNGMITIPVDGSEKSNTLCPIYCHIDTNTKKIEVEWLCGGLE
ncbi:hypothetical protein KBB42_01725 [Candidatus Dojkabacteria bacterium]|nr:hypothetical protein [Candidatus Dojkabacteria bacterium]